MKLFVIASLIAISAAARLDHLERSYLPPSQGSLGSPNSAFGANSGAHGSFGAGTGSHGSFGSNSGFGTASGSQGFGANGFGHSGPSSYNAGSSYPGATSNQYLPPGQGSAASIGSQQFGGSPQGSGFGGQRYQSQQYSAPQPSNAFGGARAQQYSAPSTQYGAPQAGSSFGGHSANGGSSSFGAQGGQGSFGARYQSNQGQGNQYAAASRQYLAPKASSSFQNSPQQAFDDETGYQY